jgi:hypothetical protein
LRHGDSFAQSVYVPPVPSFLLAAPVVERYSGLDPTSGIRLEHAATFDHSQPLFLRSQTMNFEERMVELRLEGAKEAQKRSRLALLVLSIGSVAILISEFNLCYSWDRGFAENIEFPKNKEIATELRKHELAEWVKRQNVSISLLGISVGADDIPILGPMTLFLVVVWYLFCLRREYSTITLLLNDTRGKDSKMGWFIYHGIASFSVFSDFDEGRLLNPDSARSLGLRFLWFPFGLGFRFLVFLPAVAVVLAMICDIDEMFRLPAVFRDPTSTLWQLLPASEKQEFKWYIALDVVFVLLTLVNCWQASILNAAVERNLKEYRDELVSLWEHPRLAS